MDELVGPGVVGLCVVLILREILPYVAKKVGKNGKVMSDSPGDKTMRIAVEEVLKREKEQNTLADILAQSAEANRLSRETNALFREMVNVWKSKECPVLGREREAG